MIGQTLGTYKILEQIGSGGMATVYKAYQPAMDRYVAVKVLPPNMAQDPQFATRFAQEARTIARLEHPFILPVYDSGNQGGVAYLVMRYMETGTLTDVLARGRPALRYSVRLIQRVAEALDYAHSQGVVHRDIKPSNILIDKNGQPYLTDFGIAKILEGSLNLTGSGIIGTPSYMSPEQGQGIRIDPRSDIYSLGVVLYELITGQLPFEADTPMGVLFKHIQEPMPPPSSVTPDIPPQLEQVVMKALEKDREERYRTAGEFAQALDTVLSGMSQRLEPAAPPRPQSPTLPPDPGTSLQQPSTLGPVVNERAATGGVSPRPTRREPPASDSATQEKRRSSGLLLAGCAGLGIVGVIVVALAAIIAVPGLFPATDPESATLTFAAAYDEALLTANARLSETAPAGPTPSGTAAATSTGVQVNAPTSASGCTDDARYVADVTIPDNTQIEAGTVFTKTWRVENTGTCTWDPTYSLRFVGGFQMGDPAPLPFSGDVSPGASMDISINLAAPNASGTFTGQWRLANTAGEVFGTNGQPLTTVIVVPATPTPTPTNTPTPTHTATATATPTVTATPTATATGGFVIVIPPGGFKLAKTVTLTPSASGGVFSPPSTVFGSPNAGDDESNRSRQGFVTFDLGSLPAGATITAVRLDLTPFDVLGSPFGLGCLRVYQHNYGSLDAGDFFGGTASGALRRFCSAGDLSSTAGQSFDATGVSAVQNSLPGRFQIRLQFNEQATNNNGAADLLRPSPKLIVTYTE